MKSGSNLNKRAYFFELIRNSPCENLIYKTNNISWIAIFEENDFKNIIGISQMGEWIFKEEERFYVLKDKKMYLYCAKFLENSYDVIQTKIEDRFNGILDKKDISVSDIFPFFEIVEFAFEILQDDYWFELAWMWYEKFSLEERYKLITLLDNISINKKISQRNRQKARKEVREVLKVNESFGEM